MAAYYNVVDVHILSLLSYTKCVHNTFIGLRSGRCYIFQAFV